MAAGGCGFVCQARWLRYARGHLRHLFPYLPGQSGYNKRVHKNYYGHDFEAAS